jgi:hypothetical protein
LSSAGCLGPRNDFIAGRISRGTTGGANALRAKQSSLCYLYVVQGPSHSLSDHSAFHVARIAWVCLVLGLLSGSSPTEVAGTNWLTRQLDHRVEQIEAPRHTAVPLVPRDIRLVEGHLVEGHHGEIVETAELTDGDQREHCLLPFEFLRLNVVALASQTGLYESPDDRALTPFRLRGFSTRGSPSA